MDRIVKMKEVREHLNPQIQMMKNYTVESDKSRMPLDAKKGNYSCCYNSSTRNKWKIQSIYRRVKFSGRWIQRNRVRNMVEV